MLGYEESFNCTNEKNAYSVVLLAETLAETLVTLNKTKEKIGKLTDSIDSDDGSGTDGSGTDDSAKFCKWIICNFNPECGKSSSLDFLKTTYDQLMSIIDNKCDSFSTSSTPCSICWTQ